MSYLAPDRPAFDITGPEWHQDAACAGIVDDATWFPESLRVAAITKAEAKRTCAGCDVRIQCLEFAIANHEAGVWGGTDETDRKRIVRSRGRKSRKAVA